MKSLDEVISYLHSEFDDHPDRHYEGLAATRRFAVGRIAEYLASDGFPSTEDEKIRLSLVPFIFQEANYDDIDWSEKGSDLRHLKSFFELDLLVHFAGRERSDISDDDYAQYFELSLEAIG
jgi:hypothetical protein